MRLDPDQIITPEEAAAEKGVHRQAVYQAIRTGKIPARQAKKVWLIRRGDLDNWTVVGHRPRKPR